MSFLFIPIKIIEAIWKWYKKRKLASMITTVSNFTTCQDEGDSPVGHESSWHNLSSPKSARVQRVSMGVLKPSRLRRKKVKKLRNDMNTRCDIIGKTVRVKRTAIENDNN